MCGRRPTTATSTTRRAPTSPSETAQTRGVTSTRPTSALARRDGARVVPGLDQARDRRDRQSPENEQQREARRDLRGPFHGLATVDEGQLVDVQRVQHQLETDEPEDHREPLGQVDQPLEQTT